MTEKKYVRLIGSRWGEAPHYPEAGSVHRVIREDEDGWWFEFEGLEWMAYHDEGNQDQGELVADLTTGGFTGTGENVPALIGEGDEVVPLDRLREYYPDAMKVFRERGLDPVKAVVLLADGTWKEIVS